MDIGSDTCPRSPKAAEPAHDPDQGRAGRRGGGRGSRGRGRAAATAAPGVGWASPEPLQLVLDPLAYERELEGEPHRPGYMAQTYCANV